MVYVTYTNGLKRAAESFVESHSGDNDALRRLRIVTLGEILAEWTGIPGVVDPFTELREFEIYLKQQKPADLGIWRRYPYVLFTEIRAYLLGRDFPDGYAWAKENLGATRLDPLNYAIDRDLDHDAAVALFALADRVRGLRYFRDQAAARKGLSQLLQARNSTILQNVRTLIIDEVQDLTLLQIAFLTELLRTRDREGADGRLHFVVAGDESQIVQPSGFDWGITKFMLGEQLNSWPGEFNFEHQRRAPDNLAQLIDNSWNLYRHLPKALRPSARRERLIINEDRDEGLQGRIYLCPVPEKISDAEMRLLQELADADGIGLPPQSDIGQDQYAWQVLLKAITEKPGRALIDLSEQVIGDPTVTAVEGAGEVIFLPREIKGLERGTVLINGLAAHYQRACDLADDGGEGNIPRFEARRLFDEIRVALSRSTQNLILLDRVDAAYRHDLNSIIWTVSHRSLGSIWSNCSTMKR